MYTKIVFGQRVTVTDEGDLTWDEAENVLGPDYYPQFSSWVRRVYPEVNGMERFNYTLLKEYMILAGFTGR